LSLLTLIHRVLLSLEVTSHLHLALVSFFFLIAFALGNHIECMSWIPLSHVLLSQVFTAELLMGTQSDNL
jgi:hypothetical protein